MPIDDHFLFYESWACGDYDLTISDHDHRLPTRKVDISVAAPFIAELKRPVSQRTRLESSASIISDFYSINLACGIPTKPREMRQNRCVCDMWIVFWDPGRFRIGSWRVGFLGSSRPRRPCRNHGDPVGPQPPKGRPGSDWGYLGDPPPKKLYRFTLSESMGCIVVGVRTCAFCDTGSSLWMGGVAVCAILCIAS